MEAGKLHSKAWRKTHMHTLITRTMVRYTNTVQSRSKERSITRNTQGAPVVLKDSMERQDNEKCACMSLTYTQNMYSIN